MNDGHLGKKKKNLVLLVSDKSAARFHLRKVLAPAYNIVETVESNEGYEMVQNLLPELVIYDATVPSIDSERLCKTLRCSKSTAHIPLILILSEGSEEFIIRGFECGADDCIVWPFNINILKARIKNLLDIRRLLLDKIRTGVRLSSGQPKLTGTVSKFVEQLFGIIEENFSNPLFTVEALCDNLHMSRASMYRKIQTLTNKSPQLFIRFYRLQRAVQLLENKYGNVTETCFRVGFTSTAYFAKCFKRQFGRSPKTFARFPDPR